MGKEIEHKYLVTDDSYVAMAESVRHIRQGYLNREPERTVRVRTLDRRGFLTVKGKNSGDVRSEYEYEIPYDDACEMLDMCQQPILEKDRYRVAYCGNVWEVDRYCGSLAPLTVAEIEIPESSHRYELPPFVGRNVTGNPDYYNSNLQSGHLPAGWSQK